MILKNFPPITIPQFNQTHNIIMAPGDKLSAASRFLWFQKPRTLPSTYVSHPTHSTLISINFPIP